MTLQVGFVTKDGWIIASERTQVDEDGDIRASDATLKLMANAEVACVPSGDGLSLIASEQLIEKEPEIDRENIRHSLAVFGNKVWKRYHAVRAPSFPECYSRALLVGFRRPRNLLWILNIGKDTSHATPCPSFKLAGDQRNPAAFFLNYYSPSAGLDKLTLLAAHIIQVGAGLNTAGVGRGLDIAICDHDKIDVLGPDEIQKLEKQSAHIGRQMVRLFKSL